MQTAIFWKHHKAPVFTLFFMSTCSWLTNSSLIELGGESILALKNYTLNYLEEADYTFRCVCLAMVHWAFHTTPLTTVNLIHSNLWGPQWTMRSLESLCSCVTLTVGCKFLKTLFTVSVPLPPIKHKRKYPKSISIKNLSQECHELWRLCLTCFPSNVTDR